MISLALKVFATEKDSSFNSGSSNEVKQLSTALQFWLRQISHMQSINCAIIGLTELVECEI